MREIAIQIFNFIVLLLKKLKRVLYRAKKELSGYDGQKAVIKLLKLIKNSQPCLIIGGIPLRTDQNNLMRSPKIIIGTPGRIAHHCKSPRWRLHS